MYCFNFTGGGFAGSGPVTGTPPLVILAHSQNIADQGEKKDIGKWQENCGQWLMAIEARVSGQWQW
jgi:hypothetical protein